MYSFGANQDAYDHEKNFIDETAKVLFGQANFRGGLSLYGSTDIAFPNAGLNHIQFTVQRFRELLKDMKYCNYCNNTIELGEAIDLINGYFKYKGVKCNCLIFISAQHDTSGCAVLNPDLASDRTIVGIGFNETDLSEIIGDHDRALKVPFNFTDENIAEVVDAVLSR
nr:unnamed protein product [Haemonchus contortus]